ncbi:hypothetical protein RJ55_06226 [Drechmeria coniospora]|nr:hypothetical protein RJ55_06226 [Drechmeria coniospora]
MTILGMPGKLLATRFVEPPPEPIHECPHSQCCQVADGTIARGSLPSCSPHWPHAVPAERALRFGAPIPCCTVHSESRFWDPQLLQRHGLLGELGTGERKKMDKIGVARAARHTADFGTGSGQKPSKSMYLHAGGSIADAARTEHPRTSPRTLWHHDQSGLDRVLDGSVDDGVSCFGKIETVLPGWRETATVSTTKGLSGLKFCRTFAERMILHGRLNELPELAWLLHVRAGMNSGLSRNAASDDP